MNKLLLLGLGAALALSGCRRSEFGSEGSDENTIRFTTEAVSKGSVVTSDVQLPSMGVFCSATELDAWSASAHAPNKMFHVKMKNTNDGVNGATASAWDYAVASEKQYWGTGLGSRFTFFAYAPYGTGAGGNGISMVSSASTKGVPVIRYEAPAKVTDRPDLMVATPRTNIHPVSAVGLKMGHALSKLTFSAKLPDGEAATGIKVSSITIVKAQFEGTLPLAYPLTWTVDYNVLKERNISADAVLDHTVELTGTMQSVTKPGQALFMLPQPMNPTQPGLTPVKLMVVFEVDGEEYEPDDAPYELTGSWEPGKAYDYQITYVPGTKTVDLSVTVTDWAGTVDMEAQEGTYLRVAERTKTAYVGVDNSLFYSTDYTGTVVCTVKSAPAGSTLTVTQGTGCLLLNPDQEGTYVVALTAGNLSTEVTVTATTAPWVRIGDLFWAAGNLVATSNTAGASGAGGCTIGAPTDGGLYFQFGSLVGWKGGALANGGTGVGVNPYTLTGTQWWGDTGNPGTSAFTTDAMVWPASMVGNPAAWPNADAANKSTLSDYYFNYSVAPWATAGADIRGFAEPIPGDLGSGTLADGRYAPLGVGDPCTYYLGAPWRQPTAAELHALFDSKTNGTVWASVPNWAWQTSPAGPISASHGLFFPASGFRGSSNGAFYNVGSSGSYWSSSVYSPAYGNNLSLLSGTVQPQENKYRSNGFSARCVADALLADRTNVVIPVGGGSETINVSAFNGASWTASASGAGLSVSPTSGVGNGPITVSYPLLGSGGRLGTVTLTSGSTTIVINTRQGFPIGYITQGEEVDGLAVPAGLMYVGEYGGWNGSKYTKGLFIDKRGNTSVGVNSGLIADVEKAWGYDMVNAPATVRNDGIPNTASLTTSPAATFCRTKGTGWFLPAFDQLRDGLWATHRAGLCPESYVFSARTYSSSTQSSPNVASNIDMANASGAENILYWKHVAQGIRCCQQVQTPNSTP